MRNVRLARILFWVLLLASPAVQSQSVFLDPVFDVVITEDVVYGTGAVGYGTPEGVHEINLHATIVQPTGPSVPHLLPAVIFIDGGGFLDPRPDEQPIANFLGKFGYVTMGIEFRVVDDLPPPEIDTLESPFDPALALAGQIMVPERSNAFAAQINDTKQAIEWIQENAAALHVDPNRLILFGGSSGARVALATGIAESPDDVAGVISLLGAIPGNEYLVNPGDPPLVLAAGISDPIVPVSGSIALADAAIAADVPYQLYLEDVGHEGSFYFIDEGSGSPFQKTLEFFYEQLNLGAIPGGGTVVPEISTVGLFTLATIGVIVPCVYRRRRMFR